MDQRTLTLTKALLPASVISAMEEMAQQEGTTQTNVICLSILLRRGLKRAIQMGDTILIRDKNGTLYELTIT